MKLNNLLFTLILSYLPLSSFSQTYFTEGFESGETPVDWTQDYVSGAQEWRFRNGGHSPDDDNWTDYEAWEEDITRNPPSAYAGTYNAIFFQQGYDNDKTMLITPPIDLDGGVNVELSFYLCQKPWTFAGSTSWDNLRIYYKSAEEDEWELLYEYTDAIYEWEQKSLLLPNVSSTYYLAFEGHSQWGYGTCIDEILIEETGSTPMFLNNIEFAQPFNNYIPSGSEDVPLLRADLRVLGNTGAVIIEEMEFTSLNTSDDDIIPNSLRLYATLNQAFHTDHPIGTATSFNSGKATFTGLSDTIPRGSSYIWLACDIQQVVDYANLLDVKVAANSIIANGDHYPASDQSPSGSRIVYETRYGINFEDAYDDWTLTGEFEVAEPTGNEGETGNPNPSTAYSGIKALGTDITGNGAHPYSYEPGLTLANSDLATSPTIDALYYKNLNIFFQRYLNVGANDKSAIEISTDNGASWHVLWDNLATVTDFDWSEELLPIPNIYAKTEELKIRFRLGPTSSSLNYTGWNLDDIFVTGEFIHKDIGVSEWVSPQSGSGHTATDSVTLKIANYGGADITDYVPVAYSINGGKNWTVNLMFDDIPVGGEASFTFPTTVDLSAPGFYPSILAKTFIPGDQDYTNDQLTTQLYVVPTYTPPHVEDFEVNDGYWRPSGNLWEYGSPNGTVINNASSGSSCWMTGLDENYGSQIIQGYETLFEDDFELDRGWTFTEEFERAIPNYNYVPYSAYYTGQYCLGTDLSGKGDSLYHYENNIVPATAYTATSPAINVSNHVNLEINFTRMIALQEGDSVRIEVSPDNGASWTTLWKNDIGSIFDYDWTFVGYPIPDSLTNTTNLKIRFSLFYSSAAGAVAEGFNIDEFTLTGDQVEIVPATLVSPSYDLRGIDKPLLDAKIWYDTEAGVDGATLYYSLDEGDNWTAVSNSSGYESYWNWYTGYPVSALGLNGWSGQSGGWINVRHILPPAVLNQDNVQFKLFFLLDKSTNDYDGIALDDFKIMEAPFDVGIEEILSPVTSCVLSENEKFIVRFKNYGIRAMQAGDTIRINYSIDKEGVIQNAQELYILSQSFPVGGTLELNLDTGFDMSESGDYYVTLNTIDSHPLFYYSTANDIITSVVTVNKPLLDLGPDISTVHPEDVTLDADAGEIGIIYEWQDGSSLSTFDVPSAGTYYVKATNGLGCSSYDTIKVMLLVVDAGVTELTAIESTCESGVLPIAVTIVNLGTDTLEVNDTIFIYADIQQTLIFEDTLVLSSRFKPGESIPYSFSGTYDFSSPDSYPMKLYTRVTDDVVSTNDTLFYPMEVYGYPDINLGPDTIVYSAEYILDPGAGYFEYIWQDGSGMETFTIDQAGSDTYTVTVNDEHGCSSVDAADVTLKIIDVENETILSPVSGCDVSTSITVSTRIRNSGSEIILSGESINMGYTMNAAGAVEEVLVLSADFLPGSTIDFTFSNSEAVSVGQWYNFVIYTDYSEDTKIHNDTLYKTVGVFETPNIDLGDEYQVISALQHTLDAGPGFDSYEWQDGSTEQTFTITQPGIGVYGVTVVDGNGCVHHEEVSILMVVPDIGLYEIVSPKTSCELDLSDHVVLAIKNYGLETIDASEEISIAYSIDGAESVVEGVDLGTGFESGSVIYHTYAASEDLIPGQHVILANTIYAADLVPGNDVVLENFEVLESPQVDIGNGDTISISKDTTLAVDTGYLLYEWQDGSSNPDFNITDPSAQMYTVKVTGGNGCIAEDSVFIVYDIPDLGIIGIASPVSSCELSAATTISLEIRNEGYISIGTDEEIKLSYTVIGSSSFTKTFNLESDLLPGASTIVTFSETSDLSATGEYQIQGSIVKYDPDTNPGNNFLLETINVYGTPQVVIGDGSSSIVTVLPYTLVAVSDYTDYMWDDGSVGNSYEVTEYGWYKVAVTDDNGCVGYDSVRVVLVESIESLLASGNLEIYPNPVKDDLKVILQAEGEFECKLELYSVLGELILKKEFRHKKYTEEIIDVENLVPGTYNLHIIAEGSAYVYLIVVQ
ncbi:T9SS type A sorting domain-containing protein [Bacteroidota bacterium]